MMPLGAADDDEGAWLVLPVFADSGRAACLSDSERDTLLEDITGDDVFRVIASFKTLGANLYLCAMSKMFESDCT